MELRKQTHTCGNGEGERRERACADVPPLPAACALLHDFRLGFAMLLFLWQEEGADTDWRENAPARILLFSRTAPQGRKINENKGSRALSVHHSTHTLRINHPL